MQTILKDLEHDNQNILKWFKVNSVKPNSMKFQFMILGKGTIQSAMLNVNNTMIREPSSVVLLGFTFDN